MDKGLLTSIISSLTPRDEGTQHSSIESIVLVCVDVSDFARHRFLKLRNLVLFECLGFDFDHVKSHITTLVNLSLHTIKVIPACVPTTAQILSLLSSNPNLQDIRLCLPSGDIGSELQVPLPHLKQFCLKTYFRCVFAPLRRLEFPGRMDLIELEWVGCTLQQVRQIVGPYIRERLRGHGRPEARLSLFAHAATSSVSLAVSGAQSSPPRTNFTATLSRRISEGERAELHREILALSPKERVAHLGTDFSANLAEELITMPNIKVLDLRDAIISTSFLLLDPDGPDSHRRLLPSLRELYLRYASLVGNNN